MSRLARTVVRLLPLGIGIGALAFGPGAGAASASGVAALPSVAAQAGPGGAALSDGRTVSRWAYPQRAAIVRATASGKAHPVGRLGFLTSDGQANVYMTLREKHIAATGKTWIEISVPRRPNGVTGWVLKSALGPLHAVGGRLVVNKAKLRATLYDATGRVLWSARVGVGRLSLPTPSGHFYVREKLRAIGSAEFGPYAIGTSAYAPSLSEWPGGGVVGIHGTDQPSLIPGRPSHGCVRVRNADITRLWHIIKIGTPIDIG